MFAVHIADGVLSAPWLVGGFVVGAVLLLLGSLRIRDEDVPRVALLTAAFFVASLLHVRLGHTSVHLLLNGLVGVVLGWRAGLAIPVGLFLQAALIGHGGFLSLGVNACVMTLPALLASAAFSGLRRLPWLRQPIVRAILVAIAAAVGVLAIVFGVALMCTNNVRDLRAVRLDGALDVMLHPVALLGAGIFAVVIAWSQSRLDRTPQFVLGLLVGAGTVVLTALLNALVLFLGGAEDWRSLALFVLAAHLPLAAIEGVILGFTVGFLSRVKPELLGPPGWETAWSETAAFQAAPVPDAIKPAPGIQSTEQGMLSNRVASTLSSRSSLLALVCLLLGAAPAFAHRLEAEYRVMAKDRKVKVEAWFETGDSPKNATVQVYRSDKRLLVEGKLNDDGVFTFSYEEADTLRVVVNAPGGHRKEMTIPKSALEGKGEEKQSPEEETATQEGERFAGRESRTSVKDVIFGVGFVFSAAGLFLSVRNTRLLSEIRRDLAAQRYNNR